MRLIDADKLTGILEFENTQEERDENVGEIITLDDIDRIPTSYDIEKVVEKLEEAEHNARTMIGFEKAYGSVDDRIKAEAEARALKHAIEIVKGGGVDA